MNSIHDMGGMHGFGPIPIEEDEPVFHAEWEAKSFALRRAMGAWQKWTIDGGRHAVERLAPAEYLGLSYYERWITSLADLILETGMLSPEEMKSGKLSPGTEKQTPALNPEMVLATLGRGNSAAREIDAAPKFAVGDRVVTNTNSPKGHTRLPRFARGRVGEIFIHHGAFVFPDTAAHSGGENPQHLYAVKFTARDLWGDQGGAKDTVMLDLMESYLANA
ncbi:MAG: nitrile hydratase subunit beta [Rhodospirillales bacterium]|nr:nitrile hydratase subunit beta [Rhodospirillales bacterium]